MGGPFAWLSPENLAEVVELMEEECEVRGRSCPYCGEPDVLCHRLNVHPEMWIGGSRVHGTAFHGWADH